MSHGAIDMSKDKCCGQCEPNSCKYENQELPSGQNLAPQKVNNGEKEVSCSKGELTYMYRFEKDIFVDKATNDVEALVKEELENNGYDMDMVISVNAV
eukprot:UC4_evm1s1005